MNEYDMKKALAYNLFLLLENVNNILQRLFKYLIYLPSKVNVYLVIQFPQY